MNMGKHGIHGVSPNGLNLSKSVNDINSRLVKFLAFLIDGPKRKNEILTDCFPHYTGQRNWGSYLFTQSRYQGFVLYENRVWSITDKGLKVLEEVTR